MDANTSTVPSEDAPPPEVKNRAPKSLGPWRALTFFLGILVFYMLAESVPVFTDRYALIAGFNLFVTQMLVVAPLAILALAALRLPVRQSLGIDKPANSLLLAITAFAVCNMLFVIGVNAWVVERVFSPTDVFQQVRSLLSYFGSADIPVETFWLFCVMVIGAPVAEELFFRGLLQNTLVRVWKPWVAVLFTAVIFTLFHFHPVRFVAVFELGLILGLVYHRTGSLWLVVLFHAVTNFFAFSLANSPWLESHAETLETPTAIGLALAATVAVGFLLLSSVRRTPTPDRSIRPGRMRWLFVLIRGIPLWVAAVVLVVASSFLASEGARELKDGQSELTSAVQELTDQLETVAALVEFHEVVSELRAEIKQDRASVDSLTDYLADAHTKIDAVAPSDNDATDVEPSATGAAPRPKSAAQTPLAWERDYLAWVRDEVRTRFGVDIATPEYDQ